MRKINPKDKMRERERERERGERELIKAKEKRLKGTARGSYNFPGNLSKFKSQLKLEKFRHSDKFPFFYIIPSPSYEGECEETGKLGEGV